MLIINVNKGDFNDLSDFMYNRALNTPEATVKNTQLHDKT